MRITVYGSNLTAWATAACLAKAGNDVIMQEMLDVNSKALDSVSAIRDEPGLFDQITQQIAKGRLIRAAKLGFKSSDVHWLALLPSDQLLAEKIVDGIREVKQGATLIVNQCNFGVGATNDLQARLGENERTLVHVIYIPDFIQQGAALESFNNPKRIVMGVDNSAALSLAKALIRPFSRDIDSMQYMSTREAEFTKFAITGMLAIRLGYVNELANLADQLDVDIDVIKSGMSADPRVGGHYLMPGCGFGGQNFHAYISTFSELLQKKDTGAILKAVLEENEAQKELLFRKLWQYYQCDLVGKKVAIWGVSFKPGTASIDNAPSIKIIDALVSQGVDIHIHDPEALGNMQAYYGDEPQINYNTDMYAVTENCDALLLVTEWPQYWSPDYAKLLKHMNKPLIIDGRNIFDNELMILQGFTYIGVGR